MIQRLTQLKLTTISTINVRPSACSRPRKLFDHKIWGNFEKKVNQTLSYKGFHTTITKLAVVSSSFSSRITPKVQDRIKNLEKRQEEIQGILGSDEKRATIFSSQLTKLYKETAQLGEFLNNVKLWESKSKEEKELSKILQTEKDEELLSMAREDHQSILNELVSLEQAILVGLLPTDVADSRNAILEIRPGTGGSEANLFAEEMFAMYRKFANQKGWDFDVLVYNEGEHGCKDASACISGENVFGILKHESGVHRVQRIPATEANGRVHTSTTTVAILPEAKEIDVEINDKDLRIDTFRSSGNGGQSVNKTESAIRVTHLPTGIVVSIQDEKSQHMNKTKALRILRSRLYEMERDKANQERSAQRAQQIGTGGRSERIRTYNFPQDRVTDHRSNTTIHGIQQMMDGDCLEQIIQSLKEMEQRQALENFK